MVGATSTVVDKGTLWLLLNRVLPAAPWWVSAAISYSFGVLNGFVWNRRWTFRAREHGRVGVQFVRFLSTNVVGLLLNLGATKVFLSALIALAWAAPVPRQVLVASLCAIPLVMLWNFAASKYWAFRPLA